MTEHHPKTAGAQAAAGKSSRHDNAPRWPFAAGTVPDAMRAQAEAVFAGQADLFAAMQATMAEQMERYQAGTAAAMQAFERLSACRDGAEAMAACNEWLAGSMGFFMADLSVLREQAARMTEFGQRTLNAFSPAAAA